MGFTVPALPFSKVAASKFPHSVQRKGEVSHPQLPLSDAGSEADGQERELLVGGSASVKCDRMLEPGLGRDI